MKELVDLEKLKEEIFKWDTAKRPPHGVAFRQELYGLLKKCIFSPAELAGILKGDSWVLGELKTFLDKGIEYFNSLAKTSEDALSKTISEEAVHRHRVVLQRIKDLESQVPAELAGILKGDSGVLEKVKKHIKADRQRAKRVGLEQCVGTYICVEEVIEQLEAQALNQNGSGQTPVSELAPSKQVEIVETEEERQKADELIREDIKIRRKAEAWDKVVDCVTRSRTGIKLWAEKYLLAQSKEGK